MEEQEKSLPDKRYERSMNHNYLVFSTYQFFESTQEESYVTKMLLENRIPGLLPMVCRHSGGERQYCYEINSLQSLDRLYEKREIGYEVLYKLLEGCIRCFERLEEYLLDGSQVLLLPEYVYLHMDTKEPYFICYPEYDGDVRKSFQSLLDYLLTKIDHRQEQAVWLAYQVYRYTRNCNYVLSGVRELLYEAQEMGENVDISHFEHRIKEEAQIRSDSCLNDCPELEREERAYHSKDRKPEYEYENDREVCLDKAAQEQNEKKNIIGALLCTLLVLSAAGIIFGARLLKLIPLSQKQEVGLYGAIGMSVAAAGIFFSGILKKWKQEGQMAELSGESGTEKEYWEQNIELSETENSHMDEAEKSTAVKNVSQPLTGQQTSGLNGATILFCQEQMPERCLKGMVNGKELRIPLQQLPLTIGKLAPFCDVVIPDNTVSRMHARLEEREGQIYISDLNSTNGTVRNGDMLSIHEAVAMEPGDKIMLGRVCLTYC